MKFLYVAVPILCIFCMIFALTNSTLDFQELLYDFSTSDSNGVSLTETLETFRDTDWTIQNEWPTGIDDLRIFFNALLNGIKSIVYFFYLLTCVCIEFMRWIYIFIADVARLQFGGIA